ncbi:hypothetical protein EBX93_15175, partial [bacterium]|nr:hypothetical protein [bacterium]
RRQLRLEVAGGHRQQQVFGKEATAEGTVQLLEGGKGPAEDVGARAHVPPQHLHRKEPLSRGGAHVHEGHLGVLQPGAPGRGELNKQQLPKLVRAVVLEVLQALRHGHHVPLVQVAPVSQVDDVPHEKGPILQPGKSLLGLERGWLAGAAASLPHGRLGRLPGHQRGRSVGPRWLELGVPHDGGWGRKQGPRGREPRCSKGRRRGRHPSGSEGLLFLLQG